MSISENLEDAKVYLQDIQKRYRYRRANLARQEAIELQASLAKCGGKLEICRKDFNRIIKNQSKNISEGMRLGADTLIQEQMLWDAAIGYMLVRDAIFSLKSINSYDSAAHAYEILDAAMKQMAGKKGGLSKFAHPGSNKQRGPYSYITSSEAVKLKEELLETFFEQLKINGDIEKCLEIARNPAIREAQLRSAYTQGIIDPELSGGGAASVSDLDMEMQRIRGAQGVSPKEPDDFEFGLGAITGIRPPKDA